jgi:hypothetical protein
LKYLLVPRDAPGGAQVLAQVLLPLPGRFRFLRRVQQREERGFAPGDGLFVFEAGQAQGAPRRVVGERVGVRAVPAVGANHRGQQDAIQRHKYFHGPR